jgi:hypothetical protein
MNIPTDVVMIIARLRAQGMWTDSTIDDVTDMLDDEDMWVDAAYRADLNVIVLAIRAGALTVADLDTIS